MAHKLAAVECIHTASGQIFAKNARVTPAYPDNVVEPAAPQMLTSVFLYYVELFHTHLGHRQIVLGQSRDFPKAPSFSLATTRAHVRILLALRGLWMAEMVAKKVSVQ